VNVTGYVVNGQFLVPNVSLTDGSNTLSVQATTLPGSTATASASVSQSGTPSAVGIQASRALGYAPASVGFSYVIGTLPGNATVQSVAVNFHSSGTDDYSGPLSGAPASYTYAQPGIVNGQLGVGFADVLLLRDDLIAQSRSGFPLRLTQGADGVWRISEM